MGLDKDDGTSAAGCWKRALLVPVLLGACAVVAGLAGEAGRELLRYEREGIAAGELWRLVSGHFVHLGPAHLLMNLAGLGLIAFLLGPGTGWTFWLTMTLGTIAGIDAFFWLLEPRLEWYVGLSGLLHGLLAAGIVVGWRNGHREYSLLAMLLLAKLAWEGFAGPLPGSEVSAGGPVVTAAHLYGAIAGLLAGAVYAVRMRRVPI